MEDYDYLSYLYEINNIKKVLEYINDIQNGKYTEIKVIEDMTNILNRKRLDNIINGKGNKINICNTTESPLIFFAETIVNNMLNGRIEKNIEFVRKMYEGFINPVGEIINNEEIEHCLRLVQDKFKLLDILEGEQPVNIFLFDASHKYFNSEFIERQNKISKNKNFIFLVYHMRENDPETHPIYVFLHFLGRALNSILTHGNEAIPYSFIELNKKLNVDLSKENENNKMTVISDIFACSSMYNTEFEKHNPFYFPKEIVEMFEKYFKSECKKYLKRNK